MTKYKQLRKNLDFSHYVCGFSLNNVDIEAYHLDDDSYRLIRVYNKNQRSNKIRSVDINKQQYNNIEEKFNLEGSVLLFKYLNDLILD